MIGTWSRVNVVAECPKTGDAFKEFAGRTHRGVIGARNQFGGFVEQIGQRMQGSERHGHEAEDSDESTEG